MGQSIVSRKTCYPIIFKFFKNIKDLKIWKGRTMKSNYQNTNKFKDYKIYYFYVIYKNKEENSKFMIIKPPWTTVD